MQIDQGSIDIEKIRLDIDETRTDLALEMKRFWVQFLGAVAAMIAASAGAFAAGATWWNYGPTKRPAATASLQLSAAAACTRTDGPCQS